MTVIFAEAADMGHVGFLLPLLRKLVEDGHKVEFWSGKPAAKVLPEGVEFREIYKRQNGAAVWCMAFAEGPTNRECFEALKNRGLDGSLQVPEGYDFDWASVDEVDMVAFKRRLLEPDVDLVVDDPTHILKWVGPFCSQHGVPNVRISPTIVWPVMAKQGLVPLFYEACSAFGGSAFTDSTEAGDAGRPLADAAVGEPEWTPVRDHAPQHRFYTAIPEFMRINGFTVDDENVFTDPSSDDAQCQICGPVYAPEDDSTQEVFEDGGLEAWCNEAPFVFLSLGSMVRQCVQTQAGLQVDLQKLLDALAKRRILANFMLPGYPERDGLKMAGWVPQKAILAHRNLQCFISHCGQGGVSEALHAGVPLVAYPFFHDQLVLAESIEKLGCGVWLQRFDHGHGVPVADADAAIERAMACRSNAEELGAKARGMNGFATAYAKFQEFITWSQENARN
uniref:UDP-glycosyltransferases domain-containing protein n=1 Tax=Zooxanthella nutricula TaxID=1333877 RepID=A0A7S2HIC3_9DINO